MIRTLKTAACMTLVVGTSMSMAVAQTQNDRDNQHRPGQSTPQHDATRSQPGTNTGTSWNNQNTTRDQNAYGQNRAFMDEYFGRPSGATTDYTKLSDLSGAWKLHVTMYDPNSSDARVLRTATGYAERRWILNGTKLAECYTLDGDHNALPFRGLGMNMQGMNNPNWNDQNRQDNRDNIDRDRIRRDNMNDPNRNNPNQNSPNQNNPNQNTDPNNPNRPRDQGSGTGTPTPGATGASGNQPVSGSPGSTSSTSGTGTGVNWNNQNNSTTANNQNTTGQNTTGTNTGTSRIASAANGMGKGVCFYGYDAADREFTVAWMDDQTSAIRFDEGKLGTDNELTLTGKYVDPRDNKTYQTKTIISMDGPNQQRVTMYRDGGVLSKEVKVFEITYTRDTNPLWISPNPGNAYGTVPTDSNRSEP